MTVMSNAYLETKTNFSAQEIGAARNALLRYSHEQQVHLLTVMPGDEAVAVLQRCRLGYAQKMISALRQQGETQRADYFGQQLGFINSNTHDQVTLAQPNSVASGWHSHAVAWCLGVMMLVSAATWLAVNYYH